MQPLGNICVYRFYFNKMLFGWFPINMKTLYWDFSCVNARIYAFSKINRDQWLKSKFKSESVASSSWGTITKILSIFWTRFQRIFNPQRNNAIFHNLFRHFTRYLSDQNIPSGLRCFFKLTLQYCSVSTLRFLQIAFIMCSNTLLQFLFNAWLHKFSLPQKLRVNEERQ